MNHIPRLSEAVYVGLCREVGSPTEVRIRREVIETVETVSKPVHIMRGLDRMKSGSQREGFKLRSSDIDIMFWHPCHKVICDLSQISLHRIPSITLILMECDDLPVGFTRLNLMSQSNYAEIISSCVVINHKVYISSTLFRDNHFLFLQSTYVPITTAFPHGPCSTFSIIEAPEADFVFCFWSSHWPKKALPWIQRCREKGWPSEIIVSDILSEGFHVVPIGSTPENGLEWRISFSRAEQKLVHSMNHCQFLCYGLLKLFLKEVINCQTNTPILCSYFIKTTVFWVIQNNTSMSWTPDNLLPCFWKCIKLLINMVRTGECPNFFIPQNNMFRLKVVGSAQASLFHQLYDLYCKGISCLLLSETIRPYLSQAIFNRTLRVCTNESSLISTTELDIGLFRELRIFEQEILSIEEFAAYIQQIQKMILGRLTSYETVFLQCITSNVLRNTAMFLQSSIYLNKYRNRVCYKSDKVSTLLKQSCKFGYLSDILYIAMYLYRTRRYEDSLSCLHKAQKSFSLPHIMYLENVIVFVHRHCMRRNIMGAKMTRALVRHIVLHFQYTYIEELVLEQKISMKNGLVPLRIPPQVLLHMLIFLNHHRLGDTVRTLQSLRDLQTLLCFDDEVNVPTKLRDISWQILGICQQIFGDYLGSFHCYQNSLKQIEFHSIQEATLLRINTLHHRMI